MILNPKHSAICYVLLIIQFVSTIQILKKRSSYDSATFLRTDLVELEETIPDGTCGYQALGLFLGISWLDVLQMVSTIWGESGRDDWRKLHHDLKTCMEDNVINLNCGGIDKKIWLRNEVLTALSKQQDVPILTFQKMQKLYGLCINPCDR